MTPLGYFCPTPRNGLTGHRQGFPCNKSSRPRHFRTLILAKIIAWLLSRLRNAKGRLFALLNSRNDKLDRFEGLGKNSLIGIVGQQPLILGQVCKKPEPSHTIGGDSVAVDDDGAVQELAEVVPI